MSLVQRKVFLNISLADAAGNKASLNLETRYADLAALNTGHTTNDEIFGVGGIIPSLEAVTDAQVVGVAFGVKYEEDTNFFGAAGSEVENHALITAKIAGNPGKKANLRVPAPNDGVFLGATGENRNIVDTTDAAMQTWLAFFESGGKMYVSDGEDLADSATAGNWKGKRIHRGSRLG